MRVPHSLWFHILWNQSESHPSNSSSGTEDSAHLDEPAKITSCVGGIASKTMQFFASMSVVPEPVQPDIQKSPFEIELDRYARFGLAYDLTTDGKLPEALDVWNSRNGKQEFPMFWLTALNILIIPAVSVAIEHVFSTAGVATSGQSGRLSGENLEVKVLLQRNRLFLDYAG